MNALPAIADTARIPAAGLKPADPGFAEMGLARPFAWGLGLMAVFFGLFGGWAAVAPLDSAALAPGSVVVAGSRQAVQHLEGGIVGRILVQEGGLVEAGQDLIILDDTLTRANLDLYRAQLTATRAAEARLVAERDGAAEIAFPADLDADPRGIEAMEGQHRIFLSRRDALASQIRLLDQRSAQIREEILGLEAEIRAQTRQLTLIAEEVGDISYLLNKGLDRKTRLLSLQRQQAEIEGARAQNTARIARARQSIQENELKALDLRTAQVNEVVAKLRDEQGRVAELNERVRAAEDVLSRTVVKAPVGGRVVGQKVFTAGGVIAPRDVLMEIVPTNDRLVVEARVAPGDIDVVRRGLTVQLRFSALNQRVTPTLDGVVEDISADRLTDQRSGQPYYVARISVPPGNLAEAKVELYPGMPVEAMIVTGSRTLLAYLLKPVRDSLSRSLRED